MRVVSGVGILALVTALAGAAACGDSSGPGVGPVALLTNTVWVDYDTALIGSEASNMEYTIKFLTLTVRQVNANDSTSLATAVGGAGVFVVPEEKNTDFTTTLTAGAKTVLRRFVEVNGGVLVVVPDSRGLALLDTLFNYAIVGNFAGDSSRLNATAAAGTPFAGGPAVLPDNNGTYYIDPTTLPTGGKAVYRDTVNASAAVSYIPQGAGFVVLVGWDWYDAKPKGAQDNGWVEGLRRALNF